MIIDTHVHVHPQAAGLGDRQDASADRFLAELQNSPLDRAVLLPIDPIIPNAFVQDVVRRNPEKLRCYGSVNPADGEPAIEQFEALASSGSVVGLKLHPRRQGFTSAALPVLRRLTERAAAHDLPVLIDSFPYGKGALRDDTLEMIETLSEAVPQAKLIIAHMGGIRILEALIVARTSYSIFMDLSLIHTVYRGSHIEDDIFYAIRRLGPDRCLYGSDYPDTGLTDYYESMREALEVRGFSASDQARIFGGTALDVLPL